MTFENKLKLNAIYKNNQEDVVILQESISLSSSGSS